MKLSSRYWITSSPNIRANKETRSSICQIAKAAKSRVYAITGQWRADCEIARKAQHNKISILCDSKVDSLMKVTDVREEYVNRHTGADRYIGCDEKLRDHSEIAKQLGELSTKAP